MDPGILPVVVLRICTGSNPFVQEVTRMPTLLLLTRPPLTRPGAQGPLWAGPTWRMGLCHCGG